MTSDIKFGSLTMKPVIPQGWSKNKNPDAEPVAYRFIYQPDGKDTFVRPKNSQNPQREIALPEGYSSLQLGDASTISKIPDAVNTLKGTPGYANIQAPLDNLTSMPVPTELQGFPGFDDDFSQLLAGLGTLQNDVLSPASHVAKDFKNLANVSAMLQADDPSFKGLELTPPEQQAWINAQNQKNIKDIQLRGENGLQFTVPVKAPS